jgi:hypothetical protein
MQHIMLHDYLWEVWGMDEADDKEYNRMSELADEMAATHNRLLWAGDLNKQAMMLGYKLVRNR